jgi:hypothetical protein
MRTRNRNIVTGAALLLLALLWQLTSGIWSVPIVRSQSSLDLALLAPVSAGQTLSFTHGYNDPIPGEACNIGSASDHCAHQRYGLDLTPSNQSDINVLAPLPGSIWWGGVPGSDCLGIKTKDNLNLTICHFASIVVINNQQITRGTLLGTRRTSWVHLSLDTGFGVSSRDPIPFNGSHTIEGLQFNPDDTKRDYRPWPAFTSTNGVGNIGGHVKRTSNGQPAGGAVVTFDGGGLTKSIGADGNGNYSFSSVPAGMASISANLNGSVGGVSASVVGSSSRVAPDISISSAICGQSAQTGGVMAIMFPVAYAADPCPPTPTPLPTQPPSSDGIQIVNVPVMNVGTGQQFQPSITIKVVSGSINKLTDFLKATPDTDSNKRGAYVSQGFTQNVSAGQTYTFDGNSTSQFKMTAPSQPGTYYSYWRLWIGGAFKGPTIAIQINVTGDPSGSPPGTWAAKYYNCTSPNGECAAQYETYESGTYVFRNWGIGGPGGTINTDNWSASFTKNVYFPGGQYRIHSNHDDNGTVRIDGQVVLDGQQASEQDGMIQLNAGDHTIRVEYVEKTGSAHIEVWWQGPGYLPFDQTCDPSQWCAQYWGTNNFAGAPALVQNEGYADLTRDWHGGNLGYNFPGDYFSARYTRIVPFSCGTYRFDIGGDDGLSLSIDGVPYGANWSTFDIPISTGNHVVQANYVENTGDAFFHVTWSQLSTCAPTATPTNAPTPTPALPGGVELLTDGPMHLEGNNGDNQAYQEIPPTVLGNKTHIRVRYNLHGLTALGNDASALIFDQGGDWRFVSLAKYGQNGLDGVQTVDIPLSHFPGLNPNAPVGTFHTRFWYNEPFTVDILSAIVYTSNTVPTPTNTPTATPTGTNTPTATNGNIELLTDGPMHLEGNNGDDQAYQEIPPNVLAGKSHLRITYNLHGLQALGGDASAIIIDQGGDWHFISLSNYGQNGKNGPQTVEVPLSAFPGLDLTQPFGTLHARFWYSSDFTVDITSIVAY